MKTPKTTYPKIIIFALATLISTFAHGVEYQKVTFKNFFADQIAPIALSFEIPKDYSHAAKLEVDIPNVYWIRPDEVDGVLKTGDLPKKTGSLRGTISLSEGYSMATGKFSSENSFKEELKKSGVTVLDSKRFVANGYPVLAYLTKTKEGIVVGSIYVAMKIETNVLYFGYLPPNNDQKLGKEVWNHIVSSLKKPG